MTTDRPTLVARNVHVVYRTRVDRTEPLRDRLSMGRGSGYSEVRAVTNVSLTLHEGESIGLVGSNGSGKSTLVGALAGLIPMTRGEVLAVSRPGLLGVGAALNPVLSGTRNIFLGLLALGLSRNEIRERMPAIVEFTGLDEAIGRPMRTYSSGMRARLAFTVATEVAPEILIVDEALAVGDLTFRARATARLEEIRASAGSVIVISHNMGEVAAMCTRVIWINQGEIMADGEPEDVLPMYEAANPSPRKAERKVRRTARRLRIRAQEREKAARWAREQIDAELGPDTDDDVAAGVASGAGDATPLPGMEGPDGGS